MSRERNLRRLAQKAANKKHDEIVKGMNELQRFVLNGMQKGTIRKADVIEMCVHFLGDKAEDFFGELNRQKCIKFLEDLGYKISRSEEVKVSNSGESEQDSNNNDEVRP